MSAHLGWCDRLQLKFPSLAYVFLTYRWPEATYLVKNTHASKRNLTFNLLDPDQIRLTLCYTYNFGFLKDDWGPYSGLFRCSERLFGPISGYLGTYWGYLGAN